jgi:hypothetical protein
MTAARRLPALTALAITLAGVMLSISGSRSGRCPEVTYAFEGSPPPYAVAEFGAAVAEVNRHTGLVFGLAPIATAQVVVSWGAGVPATTASADTNQRGRLLGYAIGRWNDARSKLIAASISIDGAVGWPTGLSRGDSLSSVFVHELGHVLGLAHSSDPASFMHDPASPAPRSWTADDTRRLQQVGRSAGCL